MPVKNEEDFIADCLTSVRGTPSNPVEVILVDDHSTDRTRLIAEEISNTRDDLSILALKNKGSGKAAALNLAYRHARGSTIVLLAGDDIIVSDLLPIRATAVQGSRPIVAQCKYRSFSSDARYDGITFPRHGRTGHLAGGATSFNRAFADLYFPIPEELPNEDTWLRAIAILHDVPVTFIDSVGLLYRIHSRNSTGPNLDFSRTNFGLSSRYAAYGLALRLFPDGSDKGRAQLRALEAAERYRATGRWWRILWLPRLSRPDRVIFAVNSTRWLYTLKNRVLPWMKR